MKFKVRKSPGQSFSRCTRQVIDGQAMSLVELVQRFTQGQRLVVNNRPINLYSTDENGDYVDHSVNDEDFRNVMPDIEDPVDVQDYLDELVESKKDLKERFKKSKEQKEKEKTTPAEEK